MLHLIVLAGLVVEHDSDGDDDGPEAAQERDGVAEDQHREPDEEGTLHSVGNTETNTRQQRLARTVSGGQILTTREQLLPLDLERYQMNS